MEKIKILVVDDESRIRKIINDFLTRENYNVVEAQDGEIALDIFFNSNYDNIDLIILDVMMPKVDGWEVCRKMRETSGIPIVLVSARSQDFDQIMGFESGADDYVTKPFSLAILSKRVDTLLKRGTNLKRKDKNSDYIVIENLTIKPSSHEVTIDGVKVELTLKEFKILTKLCKTPGRVYTRDALLDELWGMDYTGDTRTVDSHVARLRTKLGEWGLKYITTVYGTGYKINDK